MIYDRYIDLNMYKTFYAVAKSGSFVKASELLYVTQPAISVAIRKLEDQLDIKLFKRNNKGIQLTEAGAELLFYVENIFNTLNTAERILKEDKNLNSGEIRIGVPTHIGIFLVNGLIENFKNLYPGVTFHIENRSTKDMLNMLAKREIDILIDSAPIFNIVDDMKIVNLMEFDNCFVANKKYEKLSQEVISFSTLNNYQLLLPAERTSTRIDLERVVSKEKNGLKLNPTIEVSTTEMMYDLVNRGLGIGYFNKMSINDDIVNNKLFEIKLKSSLPETQVCMAYVPDFLTKANKQFIEYVTKEIEKRKIRAQKELRLIYTRECNYKCDFCHSEGIKSYIQEKLSNDDLINLFKFISSNYNINSVHFTGGEPFLNNEIEDLIKRLKLENARVTITSNGYNIPVNSDIFETIDKINISVHSLIQKKYEEISKMKDSFNKAISNIKILRNKFPVLKININTTLTSDLFNDKEELIDIINFSESIKADIKVIELSTVKKQKIVSLDKVKSIIEDMGYELKTTGFRNKTYEKNGHKVILLKCTCSAVCDYEDKRKACYENNDIYLSMDGNLHLCRNNDRIISICEELQSNDYIKLEQKMNSYFEMLGSNCKYEEEEKNE